MQFHKVRAKSFLINWGIVFGVVLAARPLPAAVQPNSLFSDNAVLQQGQVVPVWGTAGESENIRLEFAGQRVSAVSKNGKWIVRLAPLKAGGPFNLTISDGAASITLTNILVGGCLASQRSVEHAGPAGALYNQEGLPASPFRTDVD